MVGFNNDKVVIIDLEKDLGKIIRTFGLEELKNQNKDIIFEQIIQVAIQKSTERTFKYLVAAKRKNE